MLLLVIVSVVFFYSTLNLQQSRVMASGYKTEPADALRQTTVQVQPTKQKEVFVKPHKDALDVSVSSGFKEAIPHSTAYWNRLLYMHLNNLDSKERLSRNDTRWSHCRETNQDILQANMHDFSSYPILFQTFVQGMSCRTPPVLIHQPNKCTSGEGKAHTDTFLLFAIKSTPKHFERRQVVRETWGQEGVYQNGLQVRLVFLLGNSKPDDPDLSSLVSYEAKHFGDILQWDFEESLLNLTLKMNMLFQWTLKSCPNISFVFSGDDDVFVNTHALLSYLQSLEPSKASQLYVGHVIKDASPLRDPNNKYYIPLSFYDGPYPGYAGGGGFVISGTLLQPLYSLARVIPFFPIDDVYMGMCFKALGISPEAHGGFQTFDIDPKDRENLCVHKGLFLIHRRSPRQLKKLWKGIQSSFLTC